MQRSLVYKEFSNHLDCVENILEINCGTGEDAIWLARQNFNVTATDISPKMIEVAKSKAYFDQLHFQITDIKKIGSIFNDREFDLVFSNFGGLNCLTKAELKQFFEDSKSLLSERGKLVLVIMPKNTFWEQLYFLSKARFSEAFRRKKEFVLADADGQKVATYYYNPKDIVNLSGNDFELVVQKPIGFFVPPSYMEPFFRNKKGLLRFLDAIENRISNWGFLSKHADHFIIILQKR